MSFVIADFIMVFELWVCGLLDDVFSIVLFNLVFFC